MTLPYIDAELDMQKIEEERRPFNKRCSACGEVKDSSAFARHSGHSDGLQSLCRRCKEQRDKKYRQANPGIVSACKRLWYLRNKEREDTKKRKYRAANKLSIADRVRRYYSNHQNEIVRYQRQYYIDNRSSILERSRVWAMENRDRYRATIRAASLRRRAKLMGASGRGLSSCQIEDIKEMNAYLCSYCGRRATRLEMDHVVSLNSGGSHDVDNVTPACRSCNASKSDSPLLVFLYRRKEIQNAS